MSTERKHLKIEKFEASSKPKTYANLFKVGFICVSFLTISFADYLVNRRNKQNLKWLLSNQKALINLQSSVNYAYAGIYEEVA